ncbi:MAG: hypothetical protein ABIK54_04490 [candidate division WOR-3 bacterium]
MSRDKGTVDDKNFNELVERWRTASSDERDTFYRERLWPELKKRFKSISGYEQPEILLSLVGTSPEPVILTILALAPRRVHFICSTETERQLRFIVSETGLQPDQYDKTILKGIETGEVYQGFNELLNRYQGRKLACDITGGKKAMVVGAALISFLKNIPCYYVDPREYLADLRRPRPGSEEIVQLSNPYQVFRSVEEELADKLYNCGSYQPASEIYNTLCRKIPDPRKCHVKALVSSSYGEWFEFRFRSAYNFLSEAVNCAEQYRLFMDHVPRWKEQMEFLKPLTEDDRNKYYELLKKEEYRRSALISLAVKAQIALEISAIIKAGGDNANFIADLWKSLPTELKPKEDDQAVLTLFEGNDKHAVLVRTKDLVEAVLGGKYEEFQNEILLGEKSLDKIRKIKGMIKPGLPKTDFDNEIYKLIFDTKQLVGKNETNEHSSIYINSLVLLSLANQIGRKTIIPILSDLISSLPDELKKKLPEGFERFYNSRALATLGLNTDPGIDYTIFEYKKEKEGDSAENRLIRKETTAHYAIQEFLKYSINGTIREETIIRGSK